MKQAIAQTAGNIHAYRARITIAVIGACALAAAFYGYNLYSLISNTVAIKQVQSQSAAASSAISDLNARYLKVSGTITPDVIAKYGFKPGLVSVYITRTRAAAANHNLVARGHEL